MAAGVASMGAIVPSKARPGAYVAARTSPRWESNISRASGFRRGAAVSMRASAW